MIQGVLSGIGTGLAFAPSILIVSQYFSKRSTLAISLVTSGTPLGAIIHPIIVNHLLNGHVGFSRGVLASAGLVSALLVIACLSMRTRLLPTPSGTSYRAVTRDCSRDVPFILMTVGYVIFGVRFEIWRAKRVSRATLFLIGFYFPVFYLLLDSMKHGIDVNFSFYSVC